MNIKIKKLKLTNFKGIRSLEIAFNQTTNIFGENAAGKTSVFDAFTWLLFGKDSNDRKDFEIKTLDENNKVIPQIEHEVEADLLVESQVITIRRTLVEKWTKRRGEQTAEFTGNETSYFWNDVPMKQSEFQERVSGILDENLFKLITNPLYFNTNLKWQDRRTVLFSLAEKVDDNDILSSLQNESNKVQIDQIKAMLAQGKSFSDYKKEIAVKKKKLKDELLTIPTRIDEAFRSRPESKNWDEIETRIATTQAKIAKLNESKEDDVKSMSVKNDAILEKQNELNSLKSELQQMRFDLTKGWNDSIRLKRDQINDLQYASNRSKQTIVDNNSSINSKLKGIEEYNQRNNNLRNEWVALNEKQFVLSEDKTICPSCKRKLDDNDIQTTTETLQANFNTSKANGLAELKLSGDKNNELINSLNKEIEELKNANKLAQSIIDQNESSISTLQNELTVLESQTPNDTEEIIQLSKQIESFIIPESSKIDFSEINHTIKVLQDSIDAEKLLLASREQIKNIDTRIEELKSKEATMSQELADLENTEFVVEAFNKKQIDTMVENVNKKFKHVIFKLFSTNINGGVEECCEALVNTNGAWVPFSGGNTAGQINAGIDIINTMCNHHQVFAPIFIDNRESVNEIIATESQVINLIVSKDTSLKIA